MILMFDNILVLHMVSNLFYLTLPERGAGGKDYCFYTLTLRKEGGFRNKNFIHYGVHFTTFANRIDFFPWPLSLCGWSGYSKIRQVWMVQCMAWCWSGSSDAGLQMVHILETKTLSEKIGAVSGKIDVIGSSIELSHLLQKKDRHLHFLGRLQFWGCLHFSEAVFIFEVIFLFEVVLIF